VQEPTIRYATTADGVKIAYFTIGDGPAFVHSPPWPFGHLRVEWQTPPLRAYFEALGKERRFVIYNGRGAGLSDREVTDFGLEAQVLDLEAVVDRLSLQRFALFAFGHSGPPASPTPRAIRPVSLTSSSGVHGPAGLTAAESLRRRRRGR
jgi:hypothetical protein